MITIRLEKITKCTTIILLLLSIVSMFSGTLLQGTVYNYYVGLANSSNVDNNFWNIAKSYKKIGVIFYDISYVLFWLFVISLLVYLLVYLRKIIKNR